MAQVMGKHIEDCLMNTKITEEGKTEVFAEVERESILCTCGTSPSYYYSPIMKH